MTRVVKPGEHVGALVGRDAFHCVLCSVYSPQIWSRLFADTSTAMVITDTVVNRCLHCDKLTYWYFPAMFGSPASGERPEGFMLHPWGGNNTPPPAVDFPPSALRDFEEARGIVDRSPRGACALLRLATQKLMIALDQPGKNINDDVAALVRDGLPVRAQQALDALRVIGNEAVHPGEMNLEDDQDTAVALFGLLNFIVEQQITEPRKLEALYGKLPEGKRKAIEQRDAPRELNSGE